MDGDLLGGGTPVLFPRAEGRRDATLLDPQRLGFACRRGRWRFALVGRGRCLGGPLPAGLALGLDPQRRFGEREAGGVSLWPVGEGAWVARFLAVWLLGSTLSSSVWRAGGTGGVSLWPVGEGAWVARFLAVWLLDILDPSIGGRPERTLGSGSDFLERWSAWSPISRDGPCPWRGPWQVRWNDRDCLCRRRAIGRGARGHTPK